MQGDLKVVKVYVKNGKQEYFDVMKADGSVLTKVSKSQMLDAVRNNHKFVNASITKEGVVRVASDITRESVSVAKTVIKESIPVYKVTKIFVTARGDVRFLEVIDAKHIKHCFSYHSLDGLVYNGKIKLVGATVETRKVKSQFSNNQYTEYGFVADKDIPRAVIKYDCDPFKFKEFRDEHDGYGYRASTYHLCYSRDVTYHYSNEVAGDYFKTYSITCDTCVDTYFKEDVERILSKYDMSKYDYLYIDNSFTVLGEPGFAELYVFSKNIKNFKKAYLKSINFLTGCIDECSVSFFEFFALFCKFDLNEVVKVMLIRNLQDLDIRSNPLLDFPFGDNIIWVPCKECIGAFKKFFAAYDKAVKESRNQ